VSTTPETSTTSIALEVKSVIKAYKTESNTVFAVNDASFSIQEGEFVALVGPSGSGKTTMLAMIAGLLSPTSGSICIDGQDLAAMKEKKRAAFRRRKIGFTFQSNNLVPYLTALENVELMLRLNNEYDAAGKARAKELLVLLGMENRLHSLPRQLSGGQQQRVSIARSLISRPTVVLADEPTASLDTERAFQVVQTMAGLVHEQRRAGIMVTHDLRMIEYADRVIQMLDGHIAQILDQECDIACLADPANCSRIRPETLGITEEEKTAYVQEPMMVA
jgi:putative ABC transport system ATP-binding protein